MKDEKKTTVGRRDFLRKVGIGAVGAGAAVASAPDRDSACRYREQR